MNLNWKAVSELGRKNQFLMLAIALTSSENTEGQKLRSAFPECYQPSEGPVPLSVLHGVARKVIEEEWNESIENADPEQLLHTSEALQKCHVPFQDFCYEDGHEGIDLPLDFPEVKTLNRGSLFKWKGEQFYVAEKSGNGHIVIVPNSAIDLTL